jgi:hypothetical protein
MMRTRVMGVLWLMPVGDATALGTRWSLSGHVTLASRDERDPLLDQFRPEREIVVAD